MEMLFVSLIVIKVVGYYSFERGIFQCNTVKLFVHPHNILYSENRMNNLVFF